MNVVPVRLERLGTNQLRIEWSDQQKRLYTARELRDQCPCATCRETHGPREPQPPVLLPIITEAQAQPLGIARMRPVGNYAYSVEFTDGHNTGIYTLELLRELGTEVV
jgi:DUF971 family protein